MRRANRVIASGIIFLVIIFLLPAVVWSGTYSGGYGRRTNPYRISAVADWQELIDSPNDWDKRFILLNDLDMQGVTLTPVAAGDEFTGIFDGRGHVIRNAVINQPESDNVGLFGCLNWPGEICNLGVEDVNITGHIKVGALVGFSEGVDYIGGGSITGCYATGQVSGTSVLGGLVGEIEEISAITNCYATCDVSGGSYVGGLVGRISGSIINCYATGDVSGTRYVGGLVGFNGWGSSNSSIITSCGAGGDVSGTEVVGGLIGLNDDDGNVSNCFWDMEIQTHGVTEGVGEDRYGMVTNLIGLTTAEMQTASTYTDRGWDFEETWTICEGCGYPEFFWDFAPLAEVGNYSGGDGSQANPYRIGTIGGWMKLVDSPSDWDKCFILANDIDMEGNGLWPVAMCSWERNVLEGTEFTGVFDGNDHVIRNAIIDLPDDDYAGLFGVIGQGGQIFDLGVEDVSVTGNHFVGGLAGCNRGELTSCYSKSDVSGLMDVGALVGYNLGGVITGCFTDSPVSGSSVVGGLVGDNYNGTISDCSAAGDVEGYGYVGGLVGSDANGVITVSSAMGDIDGDGGVGGLVGVSNTGSEVTNSFYRGNNISAAVDVGGVVGISLGSTINSCYATGMVDGEDYVGGFAGVNRSGGEINSSYSVADVNGVTNVGGLVGYNDSNVFESFWDAEIQSYGVTDSIGFNDEDANVANVFGLMTAEMQTASTYTDYGWDFVNTWTICEGKNYPRFLWQKSLVDLVCPYGVNMIDFAHLANWWNIADCGGKPDCKRADINRDGSVGLPDLAVMADHWLEGI